MTKKDMIKANNKSNKKVFNKVYNLPKYISNKKRLFVPVIGYIFIVLFFSTVYWCMFRKNSTSFLITDQFNKHLSIYLSGPFDVVRFHTEAKDTMPFTINEFCAYTKPDINLFHDIIDSLRIINKLSVECMSELDGFKTMLENLRKDSIHEYKKQSLLRYQKRIDSLQMTMAGKDSIDLILEGKYVELSHLKLDFAKQNAKVCTYVLENYGNFIPDSIRIRYDHLENENIRLTSVESHLNESLTYTSNKIKTDIYSFHKNRHELVSFKDFIYYNVSSTK